MFLPAALALLVGCGGPSVPETANGLAQYLPRDARFVAIVDVDQGRDENSLGKRADAFAFDLTPKVEQDKNARLRRLGLAVSVAFRPLDIAMRENRRKLPLLQAFDGTAMSAVASNATAGGKLVSAIRTTQSFDDIADGLKKAGWKRHDDAVVAPKGDDLARVTDAGDGVVLLTGRDVDAGAIADKPPGGPKGVRPLIEKRNPGSLRIAFFPPDPGCVAGVGGLESATQGQGWFRVRIQGSPPREEAFNRDAYAANVELGTPFVYKQVLESGYNAPRTTAFTRPLFDMISSQGYRDVYRC
jgi:hypothetical protein